MSDQTDSRKRRTSALWQIGIGFLIALVGVVGLALPFLAFTTATDWARLDAAAAQQGSASPGSTAPDTVHADISDRLRIPSIGVDMPIVSGDQATALLKGGWLFPGTVQPGVVGNSVIFGHRFRYLPPISNTFFKLDKLVVGDQFAAHWNGVDYTYQVSEIKTIDPTDFSVVQPSTDARMTLITCAPAFSDSHRLVVVGTLVSP